MNLYPAITSTHRIQIDHYTNLKRGNGKYEIN